MVLRERCREQSSATESYLAGVCRIISMCPEAAFLGLTFEPWGAAGTGGGGGGWLSLMRSLHHLVDKCLPSLFPHPTDSGDSYTYVCPFQCLGIQLRNCLF